MLSEANFESPKTPVPESDGEDKTITPNNLETPKVCRAPKKRKSDFNLSVLFEDLTFYQHHFLCLILELPIIYFFCVIICKRLFGVYT